MVQATKKRCRYIILASVSMHINVMLANTNRCILLGAHLHTKGQISSPMKEVDIARYIIAFSYETEYATFTRAK
jgi:hypothetical protein